MSTVQSRSVFTDKDGRVRYYKGLDEEVPEERPEGVCTRVGGWEGEGLCGWRQAGVVV